MRKTWLITGSSRGFGWQLAQAVLDSGDTVLATARRPDQLDELVRRHGARVGKAVVLGGGFTDDKVDGLLDRDPDRLLHRGLGVP